MRFSPCLLSMLFLGLQLFAFNAHAQAVDPTADENEQTQTLIATVFGNPLYLEQVAPAGLEDERKKLPRGEYEKRIREYRGSRIYETLWGHVLPRYVEAEKIGVTEEELAAIAKSVERRMKSVPEAPDGTTLTDAERKGMMVAWTRASLLDWKVCKSLYEKYGGRVGIGSLGAWTAFDGQNALLQAHHKAGDIKFHLPEIEEAFWQHTKIKNFADAYPKGERLKLLMATPPYLQD